MIVVTGYGTVQSAVQAMKNGAYDYVTKPFSVDELKLLLERVARRNQAFEVGAAQQRHAIAAVVAARVARRHA